MSSNLPPDKVLSDVDRGDDIQRRFRYQAANAALYSLALLDEDTETVEVFCEHHEDILVRQRDNTFIGVQVKTREPYLGPFTFSDAEILKSLKRFIDIDKAFQGKFSRYVICSNCGSGKEEMMPQTWFIVFDRSIDHTIVDRSRTTILEP